MSNQKKLSQEKNKSNGHVLFSSYYYAGQHPTFGTIIAAVHLIRASLSGIREFNKTRVIDMFRWYFRHVKVSNHVVFGTVNRQIWCSTVEIFWISGSSTKRSTISKSKGMVKSFALDQKTAKSAQRSQPIPNIDRGEEDLVGSTP